MEQPEAQSFGYTGCPQSSGILVSASQHWGCRCVPPYPAFRDQNSGPCTCSTSTLPTEHPPPVVCVCKRTCVLIRRQLLGVDSFLLLPARQCEGHCCVAFTAQSTSHRRALAAKPGPFLSGRKSIVLQDRSPGSGNFKPWLRACCA